MVCLYSLLTKEERDFLDVTAKVNKNDGVSEDEEVGEEDLYTTNKSNSVHLHEEGDGDDGESDAAGSRGQT